MVQTDIANLTLYKLEKLKQKKEDILIELKYTAVLMAVLKALLSTLDDDPVTAQMQVSKLVEFLTQQFDISSH